MMTKNTIIVWLIVVFILGGIGGYAIKKSSPNEPTDKNTTSKELSKEQVLRQALRNLWADHVVWTRQYIISTVADLPDASQAATRLLKNQEDIGNAIIPYYGENAGKKLTDLLKQHILIAVDLLKAAKSDDKNAYNDANKRWGDNANDIAAFLSGANPNWDKQNWADMLNEHLVLTTAEATDRLQKKWSDDITTFDKIFTQAMMMADSISDGIVKQFPDKF